MEFRRWLFRLSKPVDLQRQHSGGGIHGGTASPQLILWVLASQSRTSENVVQGLQRTESMATPMNLELDIPRPDDVLGRGSGCEKRSAIMKILVNAGEIFG